MPVRLVDTEFLCEDVAETLGVVETFDPVTDSPVDESLDIARRRHRCVLAWLRAASWVLLPAASTKRRSVADPLGVQRKPLLGIRMAELVDVVFGPVGDIGFKAARVEEFFRQTSVDLNTRSVRMCSV